MAFVTKPEAFTISELKSTIMDRLHMGGSFLQQVPTVTVGGMPVAIKQGGALGSLGNALSSVTAAVQAAGDIAALVQNPMALVQDAVGAATAGLSSQLSGITGQLTGGQLSSITSAISQVSTTLSDFQAHTSNLSGLSSAISDTVPDFKKLVNTGNTLKSLGADSVSNFISSTSSALYSGNTLNDVKDKLSITVANKMNQIARLDKTADAAQISTLVGDINSLLNNQATTMSGIVTLDTHNYNESSNNLTASQDVNSLAEQYADNTSVTYQLLSVVGKPSTLNTFTAAITSSTETA